MASKRCLYKPAPQENVGSRDKRRPLAQGRLNVGSSKSLARTPLKQGDPIPQPHGTAVDTGSLLLTSDSDQSHGATQYSPWGDLNTSASPRREAPSVQEHRSPRPVHPNRLLELSDTDEEISFRPKVSAASVISPLCRSQDREVLVVDASRQTKNPDESEIAISMGFEHSPAKVVCHTPSVVKSSLRNTGDVTEARKVAMDHVPSSLVLPERNGTDTGVKITSFHHKSPQVIKEKTIAGTPVDVHTASKYGPVTSSKFNRDINDSGLVYSHYDQPRIHVPEAEPQCDVDNTDADSIKELNIKQKKSVQLDKSSKEKKKKKAAKVVSSRYMQAASTVAKSGSKQGGIDKSVLGGKSVLPNKTHNTSKVKGKLQVNSHTDTSSRSLVSKDLRRTPSMPKDGGKMTSTPVLSMSLIPDRGHMDASAIGPPPASSYFSPTNFTDESVCSIASQPVSTQGAHRSQTTARNDSRNFLSETRSSNRSHDSMSKREKVSGEITQLDLELRYAQYLQWVFLDEKAKKAFQDQEKDVMAQVYGLWEINQNLKQKLHDLEMEKLKQSHTNAVDEQLDLQQQGLAPVNNNLESLRQNYKSMAHSLDTTRHQIPTKGVYIPDNVDQYCDDLMAGLGESEQILSELSSMTITTQPKLTKAAEGMMALQDKVDTECKELLRCNELGAAMEALLTKESSLKIQELQANAYQRSKRNR